MWVFAINRFFLSKILIWLCLFCSQFFFSWPISDTTRAMRPGEIPGREYLFVTRDKMETDISAGKFIESGEYKGHLYGTSAESVKEIVNAGHVCVLSPHYQAIKSLRTPQLKPFIIHIRTPSFDRLKTTREAHRARSTFDELNSRGFTVCIIWYLFIWI